MGQAHSSDVTLGSWWRFPKRHRPVPCSRETKPSRMHSSETISQPSTAMNVVILPHYQAISAYAADLVCAALVDEVHPVLGCATGSTPIGLYRELVARDVMQEMAGRLVTFNLDEYIGLDASHPQSYYAFMHEHLFQPLQLRNRLTHVPNGMTADAALTSAEYEELIRKFGGIDLQILGIGRNGHLGFNEPGGSLGSRTRAQRLSRQTIEDNRRFFDQAEDVPTSAITMGLGTISEARKLLLLASGKSKANAVARALEGPVSSLCPASIIQMHPDVTLVLDEEAASELRFYHFEGMAEPLDFSTN